MSTRRGFLGALLAAAAAPAIVRADSLMKIVAPRPGLILWGDGIHDDWAAMQAFIRGEPVQVRHPGIRRSESGRVLVAGASILMSQTLVVPRNLSIQFANTHMRLSRPAPCVIEVRGGA